MGKAYISDDGVIDKDTSIGSLHVVIICRVVSLALIVLGALSVITSM